jgi:hypothetical protein
VVYLVSWQPPGAGKSAVDVLSSRPKETTPGPENPKPSKPVPRIMRPLQPVNRSVHRSVNRSVHCSACTPMCVLVCVFVHKCKGCAYGRLALAESPHAARSPWPCRQAHGHQLDYHLAMVWRSWPDGIGLFKYTVIFDPVRLLAMVRKRFSTLSAVSN